MSRSIGVAMRLASSAALLLLLLVSSSAPLGAHAQSTASCYSCCTSGTCGSGSSSFVCCGYDFSSSCYSCCTSDSSSNACPSWSSNYCSTGGYGTVIMGCNYSPSSGLAVGVLIAIIVGATVCVVITCVCLIRRRQVSNWWVARRGVAPSAYVAIGVPQANVVAAPAMNATPLIYVPPVQQQLVQQQPMQQQPMQFPQQSVQFQQQPPQYSQAPPQYAPPMQQPPMQQPMQPYTMRPYGQQ